MRTPRYSEEHGGPRGTVNTKIFIACQLADKYRSRLPSIAELQGDFGMHKATAYRWRAALAAARGIPNTGGIPRKNHGENKNG